MPHVIKHNVSLAINNFLYEQKSLEKVLVRIKKERN